MAEMVVDNLEKVSGGHFAGVWQVLDLGCGDGLVGQALSARGVSGITGMDISANMLSVAAGRGVYKETRQVDLLKQLPAEDGSWDIVVNIRIKLI